MKDTSNQISSHPSTPLSLGLVMDFFNPKLLEGARAYTQEQGIRLDARWSVRGDWLPDKLKWDGVMHGLIDDPEGAKKLKLGKQPQIELTADHDSLSVIPDYEACGRLAVDELIGYGCQQLVIIRVGPRFIDHAFSQGATSAAQDSGKPSFKYESLKSFRQMIKDLTQTIRSLPKPLGLCLPHAALAHSLTNALTEEGLKVPKDVAIVVIDKDVQQTAALAPVPLTTVQLNEWLRGFVAAEILHKLILGHPPKEKTNLIPAHGIQGRESTGHVQTHDPLMAKALTYLRANYEKDIRVPEIVTASGASRRVLEMRFRKTLNRSIYEELRRLRIQEAKRLLREKNLSITDIARRCGFSSIHYFSSTFKKEIGISPRQFQKQP